MLRIFLSTDNKRYNDQLDLCCHFRLNRRQRTDHQIARIACVTNEIKCIHFSGRKLRPCSIFRSWLIICTPSFFILSPRVYRALHQLVVVRPPPQQHRWWETAFPLLWEVTRVQNNEQLMWGQSITYNCAVHVAQVGENCSDGCCCWHHASPWFKTLNKPGEW